MTRRKAEPRRLIEFPRSLLVEPATDTVRDDGLEELLEVIAEVAWAMAERAGKEKHVAAS